MTNLERGSLERILYYTRYMSAMMSNYIHPFAAQIEGKLPPKVKEEGNRVEEKEAGSNELLSHVQELEDELKRSEQKRFDLTNDITALQIKLKASREEEGQILQEMTSLKERLLLMLRKQVRKIR